MNSIPRPWRRFSDEEMVQLARATVRWSNVPATGLLLVLLVTTLVWFAFGLAWWPLVAAVAALAGLQLVERAASRAAGKSRSAAVRVVVAHGLVAVLGAAASAATFTFVGLPLLLAFVPLAWMFVSRPGADRPVRAAAATTATGAVAASVSLPAFLAAHWFWLEAGDDDVQRAVAFFSVLAAAQLVLHGLVRVAPWLATPVLALNVVVGVVVTAVAFTIQNVGLGDAWALYVVVGTCLALTGLSLVPVGRLRLPDPEDTDQNCAVPAGR